MTPPAPTLLKVLSDAGRDVALVGKIGDIYAQVGTGRWRAEVVTQYGGPSALMPFYGVSADAARDGLASWLSSLRREPGTAR